MNITCTGTYGSAHTPCTVFGFARDGLTWYAVEGSVNVNCTPDTLHDGVDVELLTDIQTFTSSEPITSAAMLERHADDMHDYFDEAGW